MADSSDETKDGVNFEGVSKEVAITSFYDPYNLTLTFVDNIAILYSSDRFILSFFQSEPPLALPNESGDIDAIKSRCMVRLVITPESVEHMQKALGQAFKAYQAQHG